MPRSVRQPDGVGIGDKVLLIRRPDTQPRLSQARARLARAFRRAMEGRWRKEFGRKPRMPERCSAEKAPGYLARIVEDTHARRKFAVALLEEDAGGVISVTVTIPQDEAA